MRRIFDTQYMVVYLLLIFLLGCVVVLLLSRSSSQPWNVRFIVMRNLTQHILANINTWFTLPRTKKNVKGGSRPKATHSPPLVEKAPPSLAVRQQPLVQKSMRNTTPSVRPHMGTGNYHRGSLQELPHTK
jgi:hypothetical protein